MNKNLLLKGGIATMMVCGVTLTCMCKYAVKQWEKAERELKAAKGAIAATCIAGTILMNENEKLNKELNELKAKRK